jgi:hypothetical protein
MMFKMYLLNDEEAFFGFYPVVEREVKIGSKSVLIFTPPAGNGIQRSSFRSERLALLSNRYQPGVFTAGRW